MSFAQTIRSWFEEKWGGSLFLPDGWYGRPYDNQHSLTSVEESGHELTVVLDGKLTLRFEGLKSVEAQGGELVLGPFDRLRFDWQSFGPDARTGHKEYQNGQAKIVAHEGADVVTPGNSH